MNYNTGFLLILVCVAGPAAAQPRQHAESNITFDLPAAASTVLPLFGPVREGEWAPDWNPQFVYPAEKKQTAGAVFTTRQHDSDLVWMLITYDEAALRVEYVIIWPGMCATRLDIALKPLDARSSRASVTYRRTSLSEHGDEYVRNFAEHFPSQREHWQQAVSKRLRELENK